MHYQAIDSSFHEDAGKLFRSVFDASEGPDEGELLGDLSATLCRNIDNEHVLGFGAFLDRALIGAIFFSQLHFDDPHKVFMLSPVAVTTAHHGKGVGQALIRYGLASLRQLGVDVVITYGDPAFYSKLDFQALSESTIQAPQPLSMPQGWQGQALKGELVPMIPGRPRCFEAFSDPSLW